MSHLSRKYLVGAVLLALLLVTTSSAFADRGPGQPKEQYGPTALTVQDLTDGLTPTDLADALVGTGVTVSNVTYVGNDLAAGSFTGGDGIIGFSEGILLSSGSVKDVVGPNEQDGVTTSHGEPGDADLEAISGFTTYDAAVLEFDFVPDADAVFFKFVFSSDEYNEYVNSSFNDVFAFFLNGTNCAVIEGGTPITINTINNGNPYDTDPRSHPELYVNNDLQDGGPFVDTEMDGLTVVLQCGSAVNANQMNHMKLAIADASDTSLDSAVFIQAGSLTTATDVSLTSFGQDASGIAWTPVWLAAILLVGLFVVAVRRRRVS